MGTERIGMDAYVIDALLPDLIGHDRRPSALIVYLYLWRKTRGGARATVASLSMIASATGLAKRSAQNGLTHLLRRDLVSTKRATTTGAATISLHCHWRRSG
jgi:hypothetical protein